MTDRLARLMKAKRAADEASEALRRMIEHDLAMTVPDSPDLAALRVIADGRLFTAGENLRMTLPAPAHGDVDSAAFVRLSQDVAETLRGRR